MEIQSCFGDFWGEDKTWRDYWKEFCEETYGNVSIEEDKTEEEKWHSRSLNSKYIRILDATGFPECDEGISLEEAKQFRLGCLIVNAMTNDQDRAESAFSLSIKWRLHETYVKTILSKMPNVSIKNGCYYYRTGIVFAPRGIPHPPFWSKHANVSSYDNTNYRTKNHPPKSDETLYRELDKMLMD